MPLVVKAHSQPFPTSRKHVGKRGWSSFSHVCVKYVQVFNKPTIGRAQQPVPHAPVEHPRRTQGDMLLNCYGWRCRSAPKKHMKLIRRTCDGHAWQEIPCNSCIVTATLTQNIISPLRCLGEAWPLLPSYQISNSLCRKLVGAINANGSVGAAGLHWSVAHTRQQPKEPLLGEMTKMTESRDLSWSYCQDHANSKKEHDNCIQVHCGKVWYQGPCSIIVKVSIMDSIALANGSGKTNPDDPRAPMNQVQPEGGPFENAGPSSERRDGRLSHCGQIPEANALAGRRGEDTPDKQRKVSRSWPASLG